MRLPGSSAGRVGGACSPCTGRGLASRPCRQGRWWALTPPFHPYRPRLRRSRSRRSVLCATFRRLSPPPFRERPALWCPDFPRRPEDRRGHPACTTNRSPETGSAGVRRRVACDRRPVVPALLERGEGLERRRPVRGVRVALRHRRRVTGVERRCGRLELRVLPPL